MSSAERVLVVAPHPDDETIGVGGTIAKHAAAGDHVTVAIMTGHGSEEPHPIWAPEHWNVVNEEARRACATLGVSEVIFADLPAVVVADMPMWQLNKAAAAVVEQVGPTVLYVPFPHDLHKDHRELFHAFSVAWRTSSVAGRSIKLVSCYEVQSETHWNIPYVESGFLPDTWIDISEHVDTKNSALREYRSQMRPAPDARSLEAIGALSTWRGSQCNRRACEAFVTVRRLL